METDIKFLSKNLADALRSYVQRRLHFSLGRFAGRVGQVRVRITDVNGPRGRGAQSCHISAELLPWRKVLIHRAVDADLFAAIGRATEGIGRSFSRALACKRQQRAARETVRIPRQRQQHSEGSW